VTFLCGFGDLLPKDECLFTAMKAMLQALFRLVLLVWISCGGVGVLMAADLNARFMVSGGGSILLDRDVQDLAGASYEAHFTNKFQLGALAAVDLHAPLALEMGFRNEWGESHLQGGGVLPAGKPINLTVQQIFCNAVYNTPYSGGGLRLFASGGAGLRRVNPDSGIGSDVGWSLNVGGGLEARPSRRFSIRVEMRDFVGAMPRLVLSQSPRGLLHDIQASIGLLVHVR
jgi:hypothetical protein